MKKYFMILLLCICGWAGKANAQEQEIQQLLLNVEKLAQLKSILSNMYKGYTIVSTGYTKIKGIAQGNYSLHEAFLDGLLAVSPTVKNYKRVGDIISMEASLVSEYKSAYSSFQTGGRFSSSELIYLGKVYKNLFDQSVHNMDELTMVITDSKMRMSDDERLKAIDRIYFDTQDKLSFLRSFNGQAQVLAVNRQKEQQETTTLQQIHGVKP